MGGGHSLGCTPMQLAFSQYRRKEIDFPPNETETNKYTIAGWGRACVLVARCQPYMIKYIRFFFVFFFLLHSFSLFFFFFFYVHNKERTRRAESFSFAARYTRTLVDAARWRQRNPRRKDCEKICLHFNRLSLVSSLVDRKQYVTTVIWKICRPTRARRSNASRRGTTQ